MKNKNLKTFLFIITSLFSVSAFAAGWNATTHDLVAGDFNNDGRDDMLYVAKDVASKSGIVLSDADGNLSVLHQEWDSNHIGLVWHSGTYVPHVGDFNGDGFADVFMDHSTTGTNYIIHTNTQGKIEATAQRTAVGNTALGVNWGSSRLVFADFNADGRDDVYLQPKDAQTSSRIVFADSAGKFTAIGDTWANEHLGFQWSQNDAVVYAGDFDGNGQADLLVQAKPDWVMIPYSDLVIPVQRFEDQANGIVIANNTGKFSAGVPLDFWSSEFLNIQWSPDKYQVIVGDYNNDGRDDVFLQALQAGQESFILLSGAGGQFSNITQVNQTLDSSYSAAVFKAVAGKFTNTGGSQLYLQAVAPNASNQVTNPGNTTTPIGSKKAHDVSGVINTVESPEGTAVGKLPGQFSVDPSGAANYNIPIAVAPGVAGMQPELSLAYNSRGGNGQFGVGWSLTGLSAITRCPRTIAQDGAKSNENYTVDYSADDRFCLDGQRLNLKTASDTYGAANVEYRTEIETFQKVTGLGQVASAPSTFKVIDKTGMTRYYGDTSLGEKSRFDTAVDGTSQVRAWYISRIEDRFGNYITYLYDQVDGEHLLESIEYYNSGGAAVIGKVDVVYDSTRPDQTTGYTIGGEVASLKHRAKQVDVYSVVSEDGGLGVLRSYFLNYEQGTINNQSYIQSVQQCDGNIIEDASCLPATTFDLNHGSHTYNRTTVDTSFGTFELHDIFHDQNIDSGSSIPDFHILDLLGDGSANDVLQEGRIKLGPSTNVSIGGVEHPVYQNPWDLKRSVILDFDGDGRQDLLSGNPNTGLWDLITSNDGETVVIEENLGSDFDGGYPAAVDLTQDGLPDLLFHKNGRLHLLINSASGFTEEPINLGLAINKFQRITPIEYDGDSVPEIYITKDECTTASAAAAPTIPPNWILRFEREDHGAIGGFWVWRNTVTGAERRGKTNYPPGSIFPQVNEVTSTTSCIDTAGVLDWNGSNFITKTRDTNHSDDIKFLDINGDGLTDFINYMPNFAGDLNVIQVHKNKGSNGLGVSHFERTSSITSVVDSRDKFKRIIGIDYNRDGKSDFVIDLNGQGALWKLFQSNGVDGFTQRDLTDLEMPTTDDSSGIRLQDWDGDGVQDYVYIQSEGISLGEPSGDSRLRVIRNEGSNPGKLSKVVDGLGNYVEVIFKPLTDSFIYTGHEGLDGNTGNNSQVTVGYPIADFMAPIDVVSSYAVNSGNGGNLTTTHKYAGAKVSLDGRGFLGFWRNTAFNSNTNTTTVNFNSQLFPFTGSVRESTQLTVLDNAISESPSIDICDIAPELCDFNVDGNSLPRNLNKTQSSASIGQKLTYTSSLASSSLNISPEVIAKVTTMTEFAQLTSSGGQIFPYVSKSTETHQNQETTGVFKRIVTENNYDNWGCAKDITVNVDDGAGGDKHTIFTDNTFSTPNTDKWILCRLTDVEVDHTRASAQSENAEPLTERRHSSFTYNANTGVIETETIEPPSGDPATSDKSQTVKKTYHYTSHGNRDIETISYEDVDIEGNPQQVSRSTSTLFDNLGLYPESLTNAKGHTKFYDWNYLYGTRIGITGPNNLRTESKYNTFGQRIKAISARRVKFGTTDYLWCDSGSKTPSITCVSDMAVYAVQTKDSAVTANGSITNITEYDQMGREVHVRSLTFDYDKTGSNTYTHRQTRYDVLGRAYAASLPYFANNPICWTLKDYDLVGRTVRVGVPKGDGVNVCNTSGNPPATWGTDKYDISSYQYNGLTTVAIDPNGRASSKTNNVMDRLLAVSENEVAVSEDGVFDSNTVINSISTVYDYDALGNLTFVKDKADNITVMEYDIRGNKTRMIDPDMGEWNYQYNALGQLVYQKDAALNDVVGFGLLEAHEVRMAYDELGRMVKRVEEEGTTTWQYDTGTMGIGKLAKVIAPDITKEFIYSNEYGELIQVTEIIDGEYFATNTGYDKFGRAEYTQYPSLDTSNSSTGYIDATKRYRVRQFYNNSGFASHIKEWNSNGIYGATLWEADAVDAQGNITQSTLGNGVNEVRSYNEINGSLLQNDAWSPNQVPAIVEQNYAWDATGNLRSRTDHHISRHETFSYDSLYRLKDAVLYTGTEASENNILKTDSHTYDTIGNLKSKGATYQNYTYDGTGTTGGPHAVNSITVAGESEARKYHYDNNGNMTAITGGVMAARKAVQWTSFNKPRRIDRGVGNNSEFWYGPDRARYKQVAHTKATDLDSKSVIPSYDKVTTTYVGGLYERQLHENSLNGTSNTEHHHYVSVGGSVIAIAKRFNADVTVTQLNYLHRDHIGSVIAITDSSAQVLEYMSYDVWGKKRDATNFSDFSPASFVTSTITKRGYTGHEQLDNVGLIHMNGRVYDAEIGRFLSADPFIQFPESTQGFNRYTYVNNNPLSFSDPSGFSLWTSFRDGFVQNVIRGVLNFIAPGLGEVYAVVQGFNAAGGDLGLFVINIGISSIPGGDSLISARQLFVAGLKAGLRSEIYGTKFGDEFEGQVGSILAQAYFDKLTAIYGQTAATSASNTDSSSSEGVDDSAESEQGNAAATSDANGTNNYGGFSAGGAEIRPQLIDTITGENSTTYYREFLETLKYEGDHPYIDAFIEVINNRELELRIENLYTRIGNGWQPTLTANQIFFRRQAAAVQDVLDAGLLVDKVVLSIASVGSIGISAVVTYGSTRVVVTCGVTAIACLNTLGKANAEVAKQIVPRLRGQNAAGQLIRNTGNGNNAHRMIEVTKKVGSAK